MMQVPVDAHCAWHPNVRAMTICARCGSFACPTCQTWDATGRLVCLACSTLETPLAGRGERLAAHLIDSALVVMTVFAFAFVGTFVAAFFISKAQSELAVLLVYPGMFLGLIGGGAVQVWAQVQWGQSVGKRALGIKVVRLDGSPVEVWRLVLLRNVVLTFASQLCGLIFLADALFIFGAEQRCLHDLIADTKVVVAPRK